MGDWGLVRVVVVVLRPLTWPWPGRLRRLAAEREMVLEEVLREAYGRRGLRGLAGRAWREAADVLVVWALVARLPARGALAAWAGLATVGALTVGLVSGDVAQGGSGGLGGPGSDPAGEVVVRAADPAGEFTLTLRDGRLVAASVDRVALEPERLVQTRDSLRLLDGAGGVLVAVAYERPGMIRWSPRPGAGP